MPIEITMPRLSDTMEQGTVVKWHVKVGDSVKVGDVLADIETDKATMELEAFDDGKVAKIDIDEGKTVGVGGRILVLAEKGEDIEQAAGSGSSASGDASAEKSAGSGDADEGNGASKDTGAATAVAEGAKAGSPVPPPSVRKETSRSNGSASGEERIFASPLARKVAEEMGVDLGSISGSGPSGRILRKDVEDAASGERAPSHAASRADSGAGVSGGGLEGRTVQLSNMRSTIAKRLVESKQTIPHYQVTVEASMDDLLSLREQLNTQLAPQGVKLSVNDFLVRACALAMRQHPFVNSSWGADGKSITVNPEIAVGVAISLPIKEDLTGGGLVVASLRSADTMGLRRISEETRRLAKKAREKGLSIEEMSGSTFTISNLGMYGVDHFTAIINPPNTAILAVGQASEKPVVRDGKIVIGSVMSMTMSSDHRVIDGAMAAEYLQSVKGMLEAPATLLV